MSFSGKTARVVVSLLCLSALFVAVETIRRDGSKVRIAFLDVGQGDATIITRGSVQILIDTGRDSRALLSGLGRTMPPWDRTIEMLILTHPDEDHVGSLADLLLRYRVTLAVSSDFSRDRALDRILGEALREGNVERVRPTAGFSASLAPGVLLETIFPIEENTEHSGDTNDSSVVTRLRVGRDAFLFPGDLSREELVIPEDDIRVLKVAHHGSRHSTSEVFLDRMKPEEAIISVGKNSYGHPSQEVLGRLSSRGIRTLRTDASGTIVYVCGIGAEASCMLDIPSF